MKNKTRLFALLLAVVCCLSAISVTAFASDGGYYASNEDGEDTPPDAIDSIDISTEDVPMPTGSGGTPGITWDIDAEEIGSMDDILSGFLSLLGGGGTPLTPSGNMTLVDDILQDESYYVQDEKVVKDKQFITVQTKAGNTFYIIIDRAGETENVYFLNLVDESDLLSLMDDGDTAKTTPTCICKDKCVAGEVNTDCPVCKNNMSECMGKEAEKPAKETTKPDSQDDPGKEEKEPAEKEKKSSGSMLPLILIVVLAGGAALYWFKFRKPKQAAKGSSDLDDYDFGDEDDEEYEVEPDTDEANNENDSND